MTPKLLIVGHSHTGALAKAADGMGIARAVVHLLPVKNNDDLKSRLRAALSTLCEKDIQETDLKHEIAHHNIITLVTVGGNEHNIIGMLEHPAPYDFVLPQSEEASVETETMPIPYDAMRDMFYECVKPFLSRMLEIRDIVGTTVFHIDSPPPAEDNDYIQENIGVYFVKISQGRPLRVAPAPLRFKLWMLTGSIYRDFCEEANIPFIATPLLLQKGMYLPEAYYGPDPTHASPHFAKGYIEAVMQYVSRRRPD